MIALVNCPLRSEILDPCWILASCQTECVFMLIIKIPSSGHFNNEMSFTPTLFSQKYPEDRLGETWVGRYRHFRYSVYTNILAKSLIF